MDIEKVMIGEFLIYLVKKEGGEVTIPAKVLPKKLKLDITVDENKDFKLRIRDEKDLAGVY